MKDRTVVSLEEHRHSEDPAATAKAVEVEVINQENKKLVEQDRAQSANRAFSLAILPEVAKKNIAEATKYAVPIANPITDKFMRKYILAKLEFPTKGSELAQSLTELQVRVDNLFNDGYMYEKAKLEVESIDLEIEELLESKQDLEAVEGADSVRLRKIDNQIKLKRLEQGNKSYSLKKIELTATARYNEAMGWKKCVEDIMGEMGLKSLEEFDFNSVRMDEMAAKVKKWGQLQARGALEMTPSKFQVIDSSQQEFAEGYIEEQHKIQHEQLMLKQEEQKRQLSQQK